ncbi:sigma-54-dependent Fis family transcriptional regulator [Rhodobacteraceae bacterium]|nr:sigma-54-dependent Fis family transcriptional regulator [Paracoccaceae bacterium]
MNRYVEHIREIEAASQGAAVARDPAVAASWQRCVSKHGLDPAVRTDAYIVPSQTLRHHQQRSGELIAIARQGIEHLYKLVAGQDYVLMLADDAGITVKYLGQDAQKAALRQAGLYLGAEWSEARAGTCAMGACIEGGEPIIVHQSDHFDATHTSLSCTAAPIYDTSGRFAAVLDISLLSSPRPRASQSLALNLVRQTARRIEMANIMAESRRDWVLRLSTNADFLDTDPEAAIRLDAAGCVTGMTHGATRLLARATGLDWRKPEALLGRPVSQMLALDLSRIEELTRHTAAAERFVETRDGHRLFAHAIEPRREPARRPAHSPVCPAPLRALSHGDPVMAKVIEHAAALVGGTAPVLLQGALGVGKHHLARAIQAAGGHSEPFIIARCAEFGDAEEAVLFGRDVKGRHEAGLIDQAQGGALYLDGIEELPLRAQSRLVALVAEGRWRPVGAIRPQVARLRVFAALGVPAREALETHRLRRDLYYRLCRANLELPALKDRTDVVALARAAMTMAFGQAVTLAPDAVDLLARYDWPGNFLELHDVAADAAGLAQRSDRILGGVLRAQDLPSLGHADARPAQAAILADMLQQTDGNISETARRLGVNRSTVHRQMRRHGLGRDV